MRVDRFLENLVFRHNLAVVAVVWQVILLSGVDVAVEACQVRVSRVLPLVPENSPKVFGDDAATPKGLCKSSCEV